VAKASNALLVLLLLLLKEEEEKNEEGARRGATHRCENVLCKGRRRGRRS
jgi:hypothetical protein